MYKEIKGKLNNWSVVYDNKGKDAHFHLVGYVDDVQKITSRVISITDNIAETRNSKYELGFPDKSYLEYIMNFKGGNYGN